MLEYCHHSRLCSCGAWLVLKLWPLPAGYFLQKDRLAIDDRRLVVYDVVDADDDDDAGAAGADVGAVEDL